MIRHPGKFEGELYATRAIYELVGDGTCDELGDVDGFGWYARFSGTVRGRGPLYCIISEDSQGFVYGRYFDDAANLDRAWSCLEAEYAEFCEERESEEA